MSVDGMENMGHIILQKAIFFFFFFLDEYLQKVFSMKIKTNHIHKKEPKNKKMGRINLY